MNKAQPVLKTWLFGRLNEQDLGQTGEVEKVQVGQKIHVCPQWEAAALTGPQKPEPGLRWAGRALGHADDIQTLVHFQPTHSCREQLPTRHDLGNMQHGPV